MNIKIKNAFILPALLTGSVYMAPVYAQTLEVTAIDWCPQLCSSSEKPGYVLDTLKAVFKDSPYEISVKTYPWTRSIDLVKTGAAHAVLAPAKSEAPDLIYPENPIGIQRMCFFTKKESNWTYAGVDSLQGMKVGVAKDAAPQELNSYIAKNKKRFQFMPYNESYLTKSLKKLDGNRFDTFIFTYNTTVYEMNEMSVSDKYRMAGCVTKDYIYVAFSPSGKNKSVVSEAMKFYDNKINELHENGTISNIMSSYKLDNWNEVK